MKKISLILLAAAAILSSCKKLNKDEDSFLKISINGGTEYHFDYSKMDSRIISADQNEDNREVFGLETTSSVTAPDPIFWLCFRSDLSTGQTNPIMAAMPGDDASVMYDGKTYRLYNGTVNLDHFDLESFGYSEGSFHLYLLNQANSSESMTIDGSFHASGYTE